MILPKMQKYFLVMIVIFVYGCSSDQNNTENNLSNRDYRQPQYRQYNQPRSYIPNSRMYNNPYIVPQQSYNYDADQYYVAPRGYYNVEPESEQRFNDTRY